MLPTNQTVLAAVKEYIKWITIEGKARNTIINAEIQLNAFIRWLDTRGVVNASDLTESDVIDYLLYRSHSLRRGGLLYARKVIRAWVLYLVRVGISSMDVHKIPTVAKPKDDELRVYHVTDAQQTTLFDHQRAEYRKKNARMRNRARCKCGSDGIRELRDLTLLSVLFGAGVRIGEARQITVRDINFAERTLFIPRTKTHMPRTVAIPGSTLAVIRLYLYARKRKGIKRQELFPAPKHGFMDVRSLGERVRIIGRRAGIKVSSHTGRRFCLTKMAYSNLFLAQQQAGHRSLETTRMYVRPDVSELVKHMRRHDPLRRTSCTAV
jgi:site-specific recombinase XerD